MKEDTRSLDYQISVMQQAKVGEQVQCRVRAYNPNLGNPHQWTDTSSPSWNWGSTEYRIKPVKKEPREFWVYVDKLYPRPVYVRRQQMADHGLYLEEIKVREVLVEDE